MSEVRQIAAVVRRELPVEQAQSRRAIGRSDTSATAAAH
jgi:hypothetical protein